MDTRWTIFAIAILIFACLSCGGPEAVRMGAEGAYPPYNFIDDEGEVDGFERELGDEPVPPGRPRLHLGDQRLGQHHTQPGGWGL